MWRWESNQKTCIGIQQLVGWWGHPIKEIVISARHSTHFTHTYQNHSYCMANELHYATLIRLLIQRIHFRLGNLEISLVSLSLFPCIVFSKVKDHSFEWLYFFLHCVCSHLDYTANFVINYPVINIMRNHQRCIRD